MKIFSDYSVPAHAKMPIYSIDTYKMSDIYIPPTRGYRYSTCSYAIFRSLEMTPEKLQAISYVSEVIDFRKMVISTTYDIKLSLSSQHFYVHYVIHIVCTSL